jgi:hypothetical protein
LAGLFVADSEIGHLQSTPPRLTLSKRQVPSAADDLADAGVAEQVRMCRRRLTNGAMVRRAQGLGVLLIGAGWLFQQGLLDATTQTVAWCVIFFFASAGPARRI